MQNNAPIFTELRRGMQSPHKLGKVTGVSGSCLGSHDPMADNKCLSSLLIEQ